MRLATLALALFCAVISGWSATLAQMRHLETAPAAHHENLSPRADMAARHDFRQAGDGCDHRGKSVHPVLCAACYAVLLEEAGLDRPEIVASTIRPRAQRPLLARTLKPRFPPPRSSAA